MELKTLEVAGFSAALHGMRNPKNSWLKSDSTLFYSKLPAIGPADLKLAQSLIAGGPVHSKFLRQIMVWVDIKAPIYWWSEFDTYKVGVVRDSCSTMHTLTKTINKYMDTPEIKAWINDDSNIAESDFISDLFEVDPKDKITSDILMKNFKEMCQIMLHGELTETDKLRLLKKVLPSSWLQKSTVSMSYQNIRSMLIDRRNHRLPEWHREFVLWARQLPYADELLFYNLP